MVRKVDDVYIISPEIYLLIFYFCHFCDEEQSNDPMMVSEIANELPFELLFVFVNAL
jgi:hypothetical protein